MFAQVLVEAFLIELESQIVAFFHLSTLHNTYNESFFLYINLMNLVKQKTTNLNQIKHLFNNKAAIKKRSVIKVI